MGEFEKLSSILNVSFEEMESGESPNYAKYKQMILAFLRQGKKYRKPNLQNCYILPILVGFITTLKA